MLLPISLAALTLGVGAGAVIGLVALGKSITGAERRRAGQRGH